MPDKLRVCGKIGEGPLEGEWDKIPDGTGCWSRGQSTEFRTEVWTNERSSGRPSHQSAREQVNMKVWNGLSSLLSRIDHQPISLSGEIFFLDEKKGLGKKIVKLWGRIRSLHEFGKIGGMSFGENQEMDGGLWNNVGDDQGVLGFPDPGGGNLALDDFAEKT